MAARRTIVAATLLAVLVVAVGSIVLRSSDAATGTTASLGTRVPSSVVAERVEPSVERSVAESGSSAATSSDEIDFWIERIEANPRDHLSRTVLAQLLIDEARASHDLALVAEAESQLVAALAVVPDAPVARALQANTRAMVHDFTAAQRLAESAYRDDPANELALAVAGDAALDLGQHDLARDRYAELEEALGTTPAVTSRQARLAHAEGDLDAALRLAASAAESSGGETAARRAYYWVLLGHLEQLAGNYEAAAAAYLRSLEHAADHGPAIEGLAAVRSAQGRHAEAAELWHRAGQLIGAPDFHVLAALGDLAAIRGDDASAQELWDGALAAVDAASRLNAAGMRRDVARFLADHQVDTARAVALARIDLETRSDPLAHDTLAWTLAVNGDLAGAAAAIEDALAFGVADAEVAYHAAVIFEAVGDSQRAYDVLAPALSRDPQFDVLHAARAAELLERVS